jgi:molybdate transport system substrate-binding protein
MDSGPAPSGASRNDTELEQSNARMAGGDHGCVGGAVRVGGGDSRDGGRKPEGRVYRDFCRLHQALRRRLRAGLRAIGRLRERLQKGEAFDIFASAALPHAQTLTEAGISGPSVLFARNALCILAEADRGLDGGDLIETLLRPDIRIGTSTPVSDPAGDYTWEMFHKIDARRPGAFETLSKKAQQIFGGPATTAAVNGRPQPLAALEDHQIDLLVYYCSGAQQIVRDSSKYKSIALPPELSVGPEYGLTVSRKAQLGAADFAMYLLSPQGQASLKSFGFIPVALPADNIGR